MKQVRKFVPENKLARTLTDPNGMLVEHALQKATQGVEKVREAHMAALDIKLDDVCRAAATAIETQSAADAAVLYRLAREVLADAGIFGLKNICRAAYSLCELMAAGDRHRYLWTAVSVHAEAFAILRRQGRDADVDFSTMLSGLEQITRSPAGQPS